MFSQFIRKKRVEPEHLLHSEWNRRLGLFSLTGISGILLITTVYFIVLPQLLNLRMHHLPLVPYLVFFVIVFIAAHQWSIIAKLVPKNGLLFNFAYATHSELLAFCLLWSQLLDSLLFLVFVTHTLSEYMNLLFRGAVKTFLRVPYQVGLLAIERLDFFGLFAIVIAASILCCSLQVLVTVTLVFLITLFFTLTSTTIVALMQNFTELRFLEFGLHVEVFQATEWLLLLVLCLEFIGCLAEESEQPQKFLPWTFKNYWKIASLVMLLAIVAFYPFQKIIHFNNQFLLPNVFGQIGIYSARYFMNVGAVCGLCGTLIVAFLPPSRIIYTLARENFLPGFQIFGKLHGKGGAPRNAVALVAFLSVFVSILPKRVLLECVPLNVSLRLFCQALLLYKEGFCNEKLEFHEAKYNRLRRTLTSGLERLSNYSFEYSVIPSDGEEGEADTDAEILKRMREVNQVSEESGLIENKTRKSYESVAMDDNGNFAVSSDPAVHECFSKSCTDNQAYGCEVHANHYHIYETDAAEKPFRSTTDGVEKSLDPISTERSSRSLLITFMLGVLLVSTSFKIEKFVPILAIIGIVVGTLMSFVAFGLIARLKFDGRSRLQPMGCLIMITLLTMLLFHFSLIKYGVVFGWVMIGTMLYITNIICNK